MSDTVSAERGDVVLTGLTADGATEASLAAVLDRPAKPEPTAEPAPADDPAVPPAETAAPADETAPDLSEAARTLANSKKKQRDEFQERVSRLTWEKHRKDEEIQQLRAQLAAREQPTPPQARQAPSDGRPRLKDFVGRIGTDYEDHADAVEAHAFAALEWSNAERDRALAAQQQIHTTQTAHESAYSRAKAKYADIDATLMAMVEDGRTFTPWMEQAILEDTDQGHDLAYELARNPESYQSLATAPTPIQFARRLGLVLARLAGAPSGPPAQTVAFTPPPAPIQPVGAGSKTTTASLADLASRGVVDYDSSGYRERRQQERARRR